MNATTKNTTTESTELRFFWNGIKVGKGSLQKASVSLVTGSQLHIAIYANSYTRFSSEIKEAFFVQNDSDLMTDYFCMDSISIYPDHKLFRDALVGCLKYSKRILSRYEKEDSRTYNKDLYVEQRKEEIAFIESLMNDDSALESAIKERKVYTDKVAAEKKSADEKREAEIKANDEILLKSRNIQRTKIKNDNNYNIEKIIVHWSESTAFGEEKEYTLDEFLIAQDKALEIYGLDSGGYDKTKVTIITGEHEYCTRIDISFNEDGDLIKDLNLMKNYIESGKCKQQGGYDDETAKTLLSLCNTFLTPKEPTPPNTPTDSKKGQESSENNPHSLKIADITNVIDAKPVLSKKGQQLVNVSSIEHDYIQACKLINKNGGAKEFRGVILEMRSTIDTLLADFKCKIEYKGSQSDNVIKMHKIVDNSAYIEGNEEEFNECMKVSDPEFYHKMRKYGFSYHLSLTMSLKTFDQNKN